MSGEVRKSMKSRAVSWRSEAAGTATSHEPSIGFGPST